MGGPKFANTFEGPNTQNTTFLNTTLSAVAVGFVPAYDLHTMWMTESVRGAVRVRTVAGPRISLSSTRTLQRSTPPSPQKRSGRAQRAARGSASRMLCLAAGAVVGCHSVRAAGLQFAPQRSLARPAPLRALDVQIGTGIIMSIVTAQLAQQYLSKTGECGGVPALFTRKFRVDFPAGPEQLPRSWQEGSLLQQPGAGSARTTNRPTRTLFA